MCRLCDRIKRASELTPAEAREVLEKAKTLDPEHLDVVIDAVLAKTEPPPPG